MNCPKCKIEVTEEQAKKQMMALFVDPNIYNFYCVACKKTSIVDKRPINPDFPPYGDEWI